MMSQEITRNEFKVFYFMKKGLECVLTVNSSFLFFFFLTQQDGKILYLHQEKNMDTSFKDWYCKLGTSPSVINCLHYTLKYAILKLSYGVWSLCQANLMAFLHGESSTRKESVDMEQERNLWKLFATFLCLWTSIKL